MAQELYNTTKDDELINPTDDQIKSASTYTTSGDSLAGSGTRNLKYSWVELPLGENITSFSQPLACRIVNELHQYGSDDATGSNNRIGTATGVEQRASKILVNNKVKSSSINLWLTNVGVITDNFYVEIQTQSGVNPSGTVITNGTSNNITLGAAEINVTFPNSFTLEKGVTYWLVIKRSGSLDDAAYVVSRVLPIAYTYANFSGRSYSSSTWSSADVPMYEIIPDSDSSGSKALFRCNSAGVWDATRFNGFILNGGKIGQLVRFAYDGEVTGFTSLVPFADYHLTNTLGGIAKWSTSSSLSTYGMYVGVAKNSNTLIISQTKIGSDSQDTGGSTCPFAVTTIQDGCIYKAPFDLYVQLYISGSTTGVTGKFRRAAVSTSLVDRQVLQTLTLGEYSSITGLVNKGMYWSVRSTDAGSVRLAVTPFNNSAF